MRQTVMGLDPGTKTTGYGFISWEGEDKKLVDSGVLSTPRDRDLNQRLCVIGEGLYKLLQKHRPQEVAIEKMFLGKNTDTAFKLGQAFGLCVYQSTRAGAGVFPYAARFIKQSVTGSGRAHKHSVQAFVKNIFHISRDINPDEADAIACALCHIHQKQSPLISL